MSEQKPDVRIASILMALTWIAGGVGLAIAGTSVTNQPALVVVAWTVGAVGILSFFRHSVFHRADAARMGWEGGNAGFQIEAGFANLAMGLAAIASVIWRWGAAAQGAVVIAYGLYILQSAIVHGANALRGGDNRPREIRSSVLSFVFAIAFLVYAVSGMSAAGVNPF